MLFTAIRSTAAALLLVLAPAVSAIDIVKPVPAPPQLAAKSYVLMEYTSGRILVQHNADRSFEPASLTKIMTDYIVSDELAKGTLTMEEEVTVSEKAWRMGGSKMFIEVGTGRDNRWQRRNLRRIDESVRQALGYAELELQKRHGHAE